MLGLVGGLIVAAVAFGTTKDTNTEPVPVTATSSPEPVQHASWTMCATRPPGIARHPSMRCQAAMVVDNMGGQILYERNAFQRRPIASLTKLLTALVFLGTDTDMLTTATVTKQDALNSSKSQLRVGEEYTLRDFLSAALIGSDNRAARVLARSTELSPQAFIGRMNALAAKLGLDSTCVVEPTGLSEQNVSSAYDCAVLINTALENHLIREITTTTDIELRPLNRKRVHRLVNTNRLLRYGHDFLGSKTGYISEAGWCVAARGLSSDHHDVTVVVLGAPSNGWRFRALDNALRWAYRFPQVIESKS